jgi:phosphoglycolate phosphatase-like HAD superfamily hydrolase
VNVEEWAKTMQQIAREREALNAAYEDLQRRAAEGAKAAQMTGATRPSEEFVPALAQLTLQLGNFVNFEREHADKLYALLVDALRRLAEAYDIDLPQGWPNSSVADEG